MSLVVALRGPQSRLIPLDASSPANPHLAELQALEDWARNPTAPNGQERVTIQTHAGWFGYGSCHTVWLEDAGRGRRHIVTASEGDRGSGLSFGFRWSSDSQAIFVTGWHSGIDCPWSHESGDLALIHTVADGRTWDAGSRWTADR